MSDSLHPADPQQLALFAERIARSLAERPLEMSVAEHRERVAAMVREVGGATFYQLLAVGPAASPEQVHEGYERLARMVHPLHAAYLGLEGREGVLEVLFERATAAYVTLSHPGKRRDYDREIGPAGWPDAPGAARSRSEENRDRARSYFNRATAFVAKDEVHFAIELLREAVRLDPQAKYYVLLGDLQTRNQNWLRQAGDSYARALEIGGPDPKVEEAIVRLRQRMADIAAGLVPPQELREAVRGVPAGNGAAAAGAPGGEAAGAQGRGGASLPMQTGHIRYEIAADGSATAPPDDPGRDER